MVGHLFIALATCASLGLATRAGAAGDVAAGKAKAASCAGCHGAKGEGKKDNPRLAGMSAEAQFKAMHEYQDGTRKHKMMQMLAKKLSDEDIANIAAYYESLK